MAGWLTAWLAAWLPSWIFKSRRIEYSSRDILGTGAFSVVYKGRFNERDVAVKRILQGNVDTKREADFLTKYSHQNILKLFHVEQDTDFRRVQAIELCAFIFQSIQSLFPQVFRFRAVRLQSQRLGYKFQTQSVADPS